MIFARLAFVSSAHWCNCEQIPLDQVHKYLELLNRQQQEDARRCKESSTTDSVSVVSVLSLAKSTSNVTTVSSSSSVAATEKTDVSHSPATDSRYVPAWSFMWDTATISVCVYLTWRCWCNNNNNNHYNNCLTLNFVFNPWDLYTKGIKNNNKTQDNVYGAVDCAS